MIATIARNLIDNVVRFTPRGGRVDIGVYREGSEAVLQIEDSGPGIPEHERARLFDRFYRAAADGAGYGLGLAIADAVVRATGGRWRVEDSALGGARMRVTWHRSAQARRAGAPGRVSAPG